jgi:crossover junction endodeoxyribonuclease RuvC
MRKILGVDPGKSGGLSIIDEAMNLIECYHMPLKKGADGKDHVCPISVHEILSKHQIELAVIEKVGARPRQGVTSMFNFGDAYGIVRAISEINSVQTIYVTPQKWRGFQSLSGLSKEQIAEVAFNIFGEEKIYGRKNNKGTRSVKDGISDSLMIAKYGVRFLE